MAIPYALRVVIKSDEAMSGVRQWIAERSPGHLVVMHNADEDDKQPHWHALLWSDKKEQALRVDFKKSNAEFIGNKAYSLVELKRKKDEDFVGAYERYMCHGDREGDAVCVIMASGAKYTPDWFLEQNKAFYAARRDFQKSKAVKDNRVNLVNKLREECGAAGVRRYEDIVVRLVKMYAADNRPMNIHYMRSVANTVHVQLCGGDAISEIVASICAGRQNNF